MLIEKIENVNLEYNLLNSILEAIKNNIITIESIEQYCTNVKYLNNRFFYEHVDLLKAINLIYEKNGIYSLTKNGEISLKNTEQLNIIILRKMKQDGSIEIFAEKTEKENDKQEIYVSNSIISYKYSGLRNYFIDTGVFILENNNLFKIQSIYTQYFTNKTSMSLEMLEKILEKEKIQGKIAEEYVLEYERKRLNSKSNKIKIISRINTLAGYDIISYKSEKDKTVIYIEVKSYALNKIFMTDNEIKNAKKHADNYFLYIVNINKIKNDKYEPRIIPNPYKNVILNDVFNKKTELISIEVEEQ